LSLGPCRNLASQVSGGDVREPLSSFGSDLFEDWPEANDMEASVYVTLTMEASSSLVSTDDDPRGRRKFCNVISSTRHSRSEIAPPRRSRRRKSKGDNAPHKKSKKTKKPVIDNSSAESPSCGGPLSTTDFYPSK
jgi:hypothetical protein